MADYTHLLGQTRRLKELATAMDRTSVAERNRARLSAYHWLATEATGQLILDDLALLLLRPCLTPEDEGERRCVLKIFQAIVDATTRQEE